MPYSWDIIIYLLFQYSLFLCYWILWSHVLSCKKYTELPSPPSNSLQLGEQNQMWTFWSPWVKPLVTFSAIRTNLRIFHTSSLVPRDWTNPMCSFVTVRTQCKNIISILHPLFKDANIIIYWCKAVKLHENFTASFHHVECAKNTSVPLSYNPVWSSTQWA